MKTSPLLQSPAEAKERFPRIVIIIILAEFCERFSYSGMRAFLTLYLRHKLGYSDDGATETYHIFSTLVYVFPVLGGIIADNYLGKYRTILYMMFVYAAGNILVAVTAIPQLGFPTRVATLIGLFMITVGTGGIKPCVTSFGGDQFVLPQQERYLAIYFSILYFSFCTGSLIAKGVAPILRSEVHCFGDKDCYSLAFGAPAFVVLLSIVIFVSAKSRYVMKTPEGNVVIDFVKCVFLGLKNMILRRGTRNEKSSHWLDTTQDKYDKRFIRDAKKTLSIMLLFTVLPVFWALLDQLGSRWTLQATKMDGRLGFFTIKPDQVQVIEPVFILLLIPVAQKYIYPFLEKRNILKNPLHKLTLGGVLAGVGFIASGVVETYLSKTYPHLPEAGFSQIRLFNGNPCTVSIDNAHLNISYSIPSFAHYTKLDIPVEGTKNITFSLSGACVRPRDEVFDLEEHSAISFFLSNDNIYRYKDHIDKSKSGFPFIRFLVSNKHNDSKIILYNKRRNETETSAYAGVSKQHEVFTSTYSLKVGGEIFAENFELESGGVYTMVIANNGSGLHAYRSNLITLTKPNLMSMAYLLPQFLIMSFAEVLFAVTGYEFAFKESPESMKAVMTSAWLLTEAFGNVIIIVVTRLLVGLKQDMQFFFYTGLMFLSIGVFHYLGRNYKFGNSDEADMPKKERRSDSQILYLQVKQTEECLEH